MTNRRQVSSYLMGSPGNQLNLHECGVLQLSHWHHDGFNVSGTVRINVAPEISGRDNLVFFQMVYRKI